MYDIIICVAVFICISLFILGLGKTMALLLVLAGLFVLFDGDDWLQYLWLENVKRNGYDPGPI